MAEVILMPKLSDTMTEGVVAEWNKKVGDEVASGELLAEIETDKATMEFESFYDGVLLHIGIEKGQTAPVNSLLAIIGEKGENIDDLIANAGASAKETPKEEAETPTSIPSPEPVKAQISPEPVSTPTPILANSNGRIFASPLAKKMANERGIDLGLVAGSGENGRVVKRDIELYQAFDAPAPRPRPTVTGQESFTDEPVSQMRKTIAKRLAESKFTAPHFYLTLDIDMDEAIRSRKIINADENVKVSFNDLVVKACALALKQHPAINSAWMGDTIRRNEHVHIGVAVAVDEGLLVPVIRFADQKGLDIIGEEVRELAKKAKTKKLQPAEWEGNTFTISNLGMFGIEEFTAIVNPPDSCILAVGGIKQVPVVRNGEVVPGNVMKVTLSCDHRVVDGASGAAFLNTVKRFLENPVTMLV